MTEHTVASLAATIEAQAATIEAFTKRLEQLEAKRPAPSAKRQDRSDWRAQPVAGFQKAQLARHHVAVPNTAGEAQDLLDSIKAKAEAA